MLKGTNMACGESKELGFVFSICLFFIVLFFANHFVLSGTFFNISLFGEYSGADYPVHRETAQGFFFPGEQDCDVLDNGCKGQPYLFHLFASIFSYKDSGFFFFLIFFLGIVFPFTIYFLTKQPLSVLFFFTVSDFFYISRSPLPTVTVIWVVLLMFIFKKWWHRAVLLLVCILAHTLGFYLGLGALALIYFFETDWRAFFPSFLGGCYNKFGNVVDSLIGTKIAFLTAPDNKLNYFLVGDYLSSLTWNAPLPFFVVAIWGFFKEKKWPLLILLCGSLFLTGFTWRFKFFLGILCIVGVSFAYSHCSRNKKILLLVAAIICGAIQFYNFSWVSLVLAGMIC